MMDPGLRKRRGVEQLSAISVAQIVAALAISVAAQSARFAASAVNSQRKRSALLPRN